MRGQGTRRPTPHFFCRRHQALRDAVGKVLDTQDLDFDDDPDFSRAFLLQTDEDEGAVRQFMTPGVRQALLRMSHHELVVEASGDTLLLQPTHAPTRGARDLVADAVALRRSWS